MDEGMKTEEIVQALRCCVFGVPCQNCPEVSNEHCMDDVHMFAADLIERLTVENEALREKVPQWISVKDRLPEWGQRVIATNGVFVGEAFRRIMDIWLRYDDGAARARIADEVTHWMPLPPAPSAPEEGDCHEPET